MSELETNININCPLIWSTLPFNVTHKTFNYTKYFHFTCHAKFNNFRTANNYEAFNFTGHTTVFLVNQVRMVSRVEKFTFDSDSNTLTHIESIGEQDDAFRVLVCDAKISLSLYLICNSVLLMILNITTYMCLCYSFRYIICAPCVSWSEVSFLQWINIKHWLTDLVINWLTDIVMGWLIDWLIDWLAGWLIGWLVGWWVGWLINWSVFD